MSPSRRIVQPIRPLSRGFFLHAMSRFASPGDDKLIMELMEDDLESLRRIERTAAKTIGSQCVPYSEQYRQAASATR